MIYCVSDIHGKLDKFERLLALIQFSENDHLYVIGDAICIVGHTPVNFLTGVSGQPFRIWHGDGIIDIDCGCGSVPPSGLSPAG